MTSSDIYANKLKVTTDTITTPVFQSSDILSQITQQEKINVFNSTEYSLSPNSVKLLPFITNNNGKVRLYTEVNSNIKVGDRVFIMFDPTGGTSGYTDSYIMDNYLEFLSCTDYIYLPQLQGYKVIEIIDDNNEITIDRHYDSRFVDKKLYNHYISEIYIRNIEVSGGEFDGVSILKGEFNTGQDLSIDINLVQAIILSGTSYYIRYKNKYDNKYISTNSSANTGITLFTYKPYIYAGVQTLNQDPTPVSSYFSYNNKNYGYNYVYYNKIRESEINIGYYNNCTIINCNIAGGYFTNCIISGCTIKGGVFYNSPLDQNCTWLYGIWSGGTFPLSVWYDGIWNGGVFGSGKDWRNGIFNDGSFSGSTWRNGYFQGGSMWGSTWSGGTFNGDYAYIEKTEWMGGTFNAGSMTSCNWKNGTCNGGNLQNVTWTTGTFNGGTMNSSTWINGTCNNGTIYDTRWDNGTFNGGTYKTSFKIPSLSGGTYVDAIGPVTTDQQPNYINYTSILLTGKYWKNGTFNGGTFNNAIWSGGTFNDGSFINSLWMSGTWNYGTIKESSWIEGYFMNGIANRCYFHNVQWKNGIWNDGTLGVILSGETPSIDWYNGIFNNGVFGYGGSASDGYIRWWNGKFNNGYFYNGQDYIGDVRNCNGTHYGGFSGGTFYDGYFYGSFWRGIWVNGTFGGCNMAGILTEKSVKTKIPKNLTKKFGEGPLKNKQMSIL